jgi:hypothetical protein
MATRSVSRRAQAQSRNLSPAPAAAPFPSEATSDRIRAFLASMRPLRGSDAAGCDEYQRGRALIERLALSGFEQEPPSLRLNAAQCADVLNFLARSEPVEPRGWWRDPRDAPSHVVGHHLVLWALEDSLRELGKGVRS